MQLDTVFGALDRFRIEIPSWGFANTGTRFGKFIQAAAAASIEEKFQDAGEVQALTGICPAVALHVLWDFPNGVESIPEIRALSAQYGITPGSINPNLFQDQIYKHGSLTNADDSVRFQALEHSLDSVRIARELNSRDVSFWMADGSNYPGTASIRSRKRLLEDAFRHIHQQLGPDQRLLIEYKPFEPAFYHTDIADWGMAMHFARAAGPQAKVLVDTGHHYQAQNIEQIVAWLLSENMLGGFHFNDRRYADDDLTLGSIDPYQVFRIFHEIFLYEQETGTRADIAYMVDQSHNLKGKIEALLQTVDMAQQLYAKASLVNHAELLDAQRSSDLVKAERILQDAFATDVRPAIREWRASKGLPADSITAFRESGYLERISRERGKRNMAVVSSYA
ncbi:MAG TPA: TIM barrel protein [Bryobacteraceae bacterium]|jgi:L-rhamnose isomerase/sugar isomerase|nr:TIM barrel protein [Bryobacteraceae bacterium]